MPKKLSRAQVEAYRTEGYLCPIPGIGRDDAARYRACLEAFEAERGTTLGQMPGAMRAKTHLLFTWMAELVRHAAILDAVEDLIGPDILLFHLTCWLKEPGDGAVVPWHQDATYFALKPFEHVTAWVGLTDSTIENGCVHVLPGSHDAGQQTHVQDTVENNLLSRGQSLPADYDTSNAVALTMTAGEFSLHHTHLIHRSEPNRTAERRIGIGISYVPARVRHLGPQRLSASLVRGQDRFGHFEPEPRPSRDLDPAIVARHADYMGRFFQVDSAPTAA